MKSWNRLRRIIKDFCSDVEKEIEEEDKKEEQRFLKFDNLKDKILKEVNKRFEDMGIDEPIELVSGFINMSVNMELTNALIIGGPTIPMIMLFGKQSGRIYFFALKALLEDEDLDEGKA